MNEDIERRTPDISLEKGDTEPMTLEEVRARCQETVVRIFSQGLPQVAEGLVDLALNAKDEHARIRASERVLREFERQQKIQPVGGTTVQIVNAIPFSRSAYDEKGRELEQAVIGPLRVATPNYRKEIPAAPIEHSSRENFGAGRRLSAEKVDAMEMSRLGPPVDRDPDKVPL